MVHHQLTVFVAQPPLVEVPGCHIQTPVLQYQNRFEKKRHLIYR